MTRRKRLLFLGVLAGLVLLMSLVAHRPGVQQVSQTEGGSSLAPPSRQPSSPGPSSLGPGMAIPQTISSPLASPQATSRPRTAQAKVPRPDLVIFLALDTLRADYLGCYGYKVPRGSISPNIDAMAREGCLFEQAYSQGDRTLVSFSSLFTGLYPGRFDSGNEEFNSWRVAANYPTLASLVASVGGKTAGYVSNPSLSPDFGFSHGFDTYESYHYGFWQTFSPALNWIAKAQPTLRTHQPHFLFLHSNDVHDPYLKPLGMDHLLAPGYHGIGSTIVRTEDSVLRRLGGRRFYTKNLTVPVEDIQAPNQAPFVSLTERDVAYLKSAYAGGVSYADIYVGALRQYLRSLGLERRTLIVLFADHGECLGERGLWGHGHKIGLEDEVLHVPLLLCWPGTIPGGQRIHSLVELVDLMPTVLELWQMDPGRDLAGKSLLDMALKGQEDPTRVTAFGVSPDARQSRLSVRTQDAFAQFTIYATGTSQPALPRLTRLYRKASPQASSQASSKALWEDKTTDPKQAALQQRLESLLEARSRSTWTFQQ